MTAIVTSEYINNTFQIQYGNGKGTAFRPIHTKKYSYLITATHVISDRNQNLLRAGDEIKIRFNNSWHNIETVKVLHNKNQDSSVFVIGGQYESPFKINLGSNGIFYSQDIFILGFPLGIAPIIDKIGNQIKTIPIPVVKKGVVSSIPTKNDSFYYVDIHINQGFSGGPALFMDIKNNKMKIFGVVSEFKFDKIDGKTFTVNSGIGIIRDISFAHELVLQAQKELQDIPNTTEQR